MTPGEARGKKHKVSREPRRRRYYFLYRRLRGLPQRFITVTPGYTGGHNGNDPSDLALIFILKLNPPCGEIFQSIIRQTRK